MRDWTADERGRLDGYLEQARLAADAKRVRPGAPALISLNNGGDRRRKRKIAWAVVAEGEQPKDRGKLRVCCGSDGSDGSGGGGAAGSGNEALEVSRDEVQPVQVRLRRVEQPRLLCFFPFGFGLGPVVLCCIHV